MRSVLNKFNPFVWSERLIKIITTVFFAITVPVYLFIGLQPATAVDPAELNYASLNITGINLKTPVQPLSLSDNHELIAPATIAGSFSNHQNKTLIIGHSSTVFKQLNQAKIDNQIIYANSSYTITDITTVEKTKINMNHLLSAANQPTIILMTCAGEPLGGQDYSHRLIITAVQNS